MGGDHGPSITLPACRAFLEAHPQAELVLVGTADALQGAAGWPRCTLVTAAEVVTMDDAVEVALRRKRDSSMRVAIAQLKADDHRAAAADVCVSAGNTGALMAMSKLILRMVEGVHRPALVASWPTRHGVTAMLDLGADISADAEQLVEFAIMGAAFARAVHHKENPSIGLLNVGSEELKGHEELREAARLMRVSGLGLNFQGFVEGNDIARGAVDVVVTDGFTGNIALKTAEGMAKMISELLKEAFTSSLLAKMGALVAMPALKAFRSRLDPREVNGAVLMGLNGIVVKSHGGTDALGFSRALGVGADLGGSGFKAEIAESLRRMVASARPEPAEASNEEATP